MGIKASSSSFSLSVLILDWNTFSKSRKKREYISGSTSSSSNNNSTHNSDAVKYPCYTFALSLEKRDNICFLKCILKYCVHLFLFVCNCSKNKKIQTSTLSIQVTFSSTPECGSYHLCTSPASQCVVYK